MGSPSFFWWAVSQIVYNMFRLQPVLLKQKNMVREKKRDLLGREERGGEDDSIQHAAVRKPAEATGEVDKHM